MCGDPRLAEWSESTSLHTPSTVPTRVSDVRVYRYQLRRHSCSSAADTQRTPTSATSTGRAIDDIFIIRGRNSTAARKTEQKESQTRVSSGAANSGVTGGPGFRTSVVATPPTRGKAKHVIKTTHAAAALTRFPPFPSFITPVAAS